MNTVYIKEIQFTNGHTLDWSHEDDVFDVLNMLTRVGGRLYTPAELVDYDSDTGVLYVRHNRKDV